MKNPFIFEAEPFEFDSEFQEETESFDAYEEEQCPQSCQCTRCTADKAGLPAEYEEEQPDAYSEFDDEWDELDTELADSEWEEERGRRFPVRRTSFRPRPRLRPQPFGRLPKPPKRPIPPRYPRPPRRPRYGPITVFPEPVAVFPEPPIVEPEPQDAEPTEPGDSQPAGPEDAQPAEPGDSQPSGPEDTQAAEPGTDAQAEFDSEGETRGSVAGRWVRQGHMIIVDDPRPSARATDREIARNFSRSVPRFPAKPAGSVGSPSPLPVPLFPPKPADPLTANLKMEGALKSAIAKFEKDRKLKPGTFPVRFTFVEITDPSGSFPSAGYLETKTDYIASEAKVVVMYSAYVLRDMVRRFAASPGANSANLFTRLAKEMDPSIIKASKNISRSLLMDVHRVPSYRNVFAMQPTTWGLRVTVAFTPGFNSALEGMIVPSNNVHAGTCVRGVGYGYLNGALAEGGFFNPSSDQGLWVAGDFQQGKKWPYVRIVSSNDGLVAQAGTTRDMAKLVALIMTDRVLDPASCNEMRGRLARAAKGIDTPWVARTGVFKAGTITHNKLGLGPLKSGKLVRSEVSVYQSPVARGRRYVVAWHNLVGLQPIGLADIARIIKSTITEFESRLVREEEAWVMRNSFVFEAEPFEFDEYEEELDIELADETWQGEVNRSSRDYVRWVQSALNKVMGLRLTVDGLMGSQTRSAIRSFQQRQRLTADGVVGPQTEQALIAAGASPPPGGAAGTTPGAGPIVMPPLVVSVKPFVVLDRFQFDRSSFPSTHSPIIERLAHLVVASQATAQPIRSIRLVGHTDPTGPAPYNVELGKRRALEVRKQLIEAIDKLSPGLGTSLKDDIVAQSLGETRPVASNQTPQWRERNRRVEVFIPTTCQSFLAQYDLRFLPGDPVFGIPAHPNLTQAENNRRSADVGKMVEELVKRRDKRAAEALAGRVPAANPLPFNAAANSLHSIARRLSVGQLTLYREFFPDGAGGIDFERLQECFEQFANGELRSPHSVAQSQGVGEPNGGFFFLFAEFAFLCIDSRIDAALWTQGLRVFVKTQELFMHVYRPAPVSPPPAVGAALPACPVGPDSKPRPRRGLDDFRNSNFNPVGQSNQARKGSLRTKYAPRGVDALRQAARENMQRAQCMP